MKQSLSSEANISQSRNSPYFVTPETSFLWPQGLATCSYPDTRKSNLCHPILFQIRFNSVLPSIFSFSKWSLFFMSLRQKFCTLLSSSPQFMQRSPFVSSLIWPPEWYSVKSTGREGQSLWPRGLRLRSVSVRLLGYDFEYHRGHACLSVVSVVCCQVQLSATGRSLLLGSTAECDLETSKWESLSQLGAIEPWKKNTALHYAVFLRSRVTFSVLRTKSHVFNEKWVFFFWCKAATGLENASVFTLSSSLTSKDVNSIICTIMCMEEG